MPSDPAAAGSKRPVRLGKYEILAHIATGGMGTVYRARDTERGLDVALKVVGPAARGNALERFRREARHAARLRHENIVTLYEYGEADGTCYLALELVDGVDLGEYIARKVELAAAIDQRTLTDGVQAFVETQRSKAKIDAG